MLEPYLSFFLGHWMLTAAFLVVAVVFLFNEWRQRAFGAVRVTDQELVNLLNHSDAVVIDIRAIEQFQMGHILGAINLPKAQLEGQLQSLQKYKTKALVFVCGNGTEAPEVCRGLMKSGFTKLHYLSTGMTGWIQNGMPVVKK